MSNAVFPTLPGLAWDIQRTPMWSTTRKSSVSLREFRTANASYPRYKYKLTFEFLRQRTGFTEMATLAGFFNACQGGFDSFLYADPDDYTVTAQVLGVGDASNKLFQLVRTWGGFVEPVYDVNSAPLIYVNGVLQTLTTHYTVSVTGLVTFVTAPGAGLSVTWTGTYYRRMCFSQDVAEFSQFMKNLWSLKTLEMLTAKP
jgi:uncharacterized protein (TIGR02217 family)